MLIPIYRRARILRTPNLSVPVIQRDHNSQFRRSGNRVTGRLAGSLSRLLSF